jgi:hypothetical protein
MNTNRSVTISLANAALSFPPPKSISAPSAMTPNFGSYSGKTISDILKSF